MKTIKLLQLVFKQKLNLEKVPYFRSAIVDSFGLRASRYDNHDVRGGDLYRYPLVQYKFDQYQQASILFLEEGVELFAAKPLGFPKQLRIGKEKRNFELQTAPFNEYTLQVTPTQFHHYRIRHWMALNQKNYSKYKALGAQEKIQFLEGLLANHIIAFCKAVQWHPAHRFELRFTDLPSMQNVYFKEGYKKAFTVSFAATIQLPDYIGLGKSPSIGFGVLRHLGQET